MCQNNDLATLKMITEELLNCLNIENPIAVGNTKNMVRLKTCEVSYSIYQYLMTYRGVRKRVVLGIPQ